MKRFLSWSTRVAGAVAVVAGLAACGSTAASYEMSGAEMAPLESGAARQVIRHAWLTVVVPDVSAAADHVAAVVDGADGYIQQSRRSDDQPVHLTLRIPAGNLDAVLEELRGLGAVEHESVSTSDVTEQVIDLEARAANLEAVRDRLRGYLDRAVDLEDIIAIERELTRVQTELDTITARLNLVRSEVAMAQVSLTLRRARVLGPLGLLVTGVAWILEKLFVLR